MAPYRLHII